MNFGLQIFKSVAKSFGQVPRLVQSARTGILRISTMAFLQFQRVSGAVGAWVNNLKNNIIQKLRQIRLPSLNIPSSKIQIVINVTINISGNLSALQQFQRSPGKIAAMFRNLGATVNKVFQIIKQLKLPSLNLKPIARAAAAIKQVLLNAFTGGLQRFKQGIGAISSGFGKLRNYISTALQNSQIRLPLPNVRQWLKNLLGAVNAAAPTVKKSFQNFGSMVGSVVSLENGQKLYQATVGGAMEQQKRKDMFKFRAGNETENVGESMFHKFKSEALEAGVDVNDYLSTALTFMPVAQNADQISKLSKLAHRLATFDPENQGIQANGLALKEALSGDPVSMAALAKRFGMSQNQVNELKLDKLAEKGDNEGFISGVDKLFEMNNMGQQAYTNMLNSPVEQVGTLKTRVNNAFAETGQAAFKALGKVVNDLNKAFEDQRFKPFFDGLQAGFYAIATGVEAFAGIIMSNIGLVQNILLALGIVLLVLAGIWIIQWLAALWPVFLIIGVIVLLLEILSQWGITTSQVVGFVAGLFFSLFAAIHNQIALFWNVIVSVAEFFANVWNEPGYAFKKLFYDLLKNVSGNLTTFINTAITGLNWLIEKVNKITGSKFSLISKFENEWVDKLKPDPKEGTVDLSNMRWEQMDLANAFNQGQDFANKAMNFNIPEGMDLDKKVPPPPPPPDNSHLWNNTRNFPVGQQPGSELPNLNHVNSIGQIENTVDISSEDLEVMRDLAEIQSIQNFVTLTPTVQVTTGDIHQPTDANEMIRRIEEVMSREIANSAQGVYA
ncbi:hypothetical protein SAMN04487970_101671 [Paenibacillus tianmuensis]|uniref:Phage-related minor tail protein n=1 Tax=Paenibacillus tianmuensis TaxID=624147 RepID=A0A1G4RJV7_9BACL|nr:hypothetical protein [Paenibacillus tianmuensis]SCW57212.1 hypothetical protein SAMN04487970_101671 [Paenibacillus tianmuensis]